MRCKAVASTNIFILFSIDSRDYTLPPLIMEAQKLNKVLQTNIPMVLTLKKRSGPYDDSYNEGKKNWLYIFTDGSRDLKHYANENQQETLSLFKEGEEIQVVRQEKINDTTNTRYSVYIFTPAHGAEADMAANPELRGNVGQETQKKKEISYDTQQRMKEMQISLQGYHQAHINAGKTNAEAMQLAIEARNMLIAHILQEFNDS